MKKSYYKIELRMGEWILEEDQDVGSKEEKVEELFYYSDGYIIVQDNIITGFLSNDLITGNLTENEIFIEILENDQGRLKYSSFEKEFDFIELPGEYALIPQDIEEIPGLKNYFAIIW